MADPVPPSTALFATRRVWNLVEAARRTLMQRSVDVVIVGSGVAGSLVFGCQELELFVEVGLRLMCGDHNTAAISKRRFDPRSGLRNFSHLESIT